ncbi:MAG TPA: Ig-like domain repeat protein [Gemmatimonadales bacterium]|nr:Ig-like domain repeat protein [Gemmatimonadales bacterium]
MPNYIRSIRPWLAAAMAAAFAACGGTDLTLPSDSVAAKIVIIDGDKQAGVVGGKLSDKLVVRVTDSRDRPVENQQVTFTPSAGQGTAVPATATTNADGRAEAEWVLGPSAGAQQLTAKPTGNSAPANLSVTFTATATASLAAKIEKVAGDNQSAVAGNAVAKPPKVKVTDTEGNAVEGVPVTFAVATGGGSVNPSTPVNTDANGFAAATSWTLGTTAGANTLTATVAGDGVAGNPATFTATGTVGSAGKLAMVQQPSSTAQSGVPFAQQPRVQLQDAGGNPVHSAGIGVTAAIASGTGGTLGGQLTAITNGQGIASFSNLSISGTAGSYTLQFTNPTLTGVASGPVQLGAGAAASIAANSAKSQPAFIGTAVAEPPSVIVKDANGNPVAGVAVTFTVASGGGSINPASPATITTGSNGTAALTSWTLGPLPDSNSVTATAAGVSGSVTFSATGSPLPPTPTTTEISSSAPSSTYGQAVTFTATVTSIGGTPTGNVTFKVGASCAAGTVLGTVKPLAGNTASSDPISNLAVAGSPYTIWACYSPTGNFTASDASLTQTVSKASTSVTTTSDKTSYNAGEAVTLSATVTPTTATGTVEFTDGGTALGPGTIVVDGVATLTISGGLSVGAHQIRAQYQGDANFAQSQSAPYALTVNAVNSAPTATDDAYSTEANTPLTIGAPGVLENDTDIDSDVLTAGNPTLPANGAVTLNPDGGFTYTPNADFVGTDSWTYQANDGKGGTATATVTITVTAAPPE